MNTAATPSIVPRPAPQPLLDALAARFGAQCSTALAVREQHGRDESPFDAPPPAAVVFCDSTLDVADAVKLCAAHDYPVIAWGAGSSLEGQLLAVRGGVVLDLTRMNRVLDIATGDLLATVQAGVTRKQLNDELRHTGLFFPIDPGADATLGGMTATRASGTNAVRYGTMRENVLALTVVLADGRVLRTGTRARKSSAGYDLTRLFVGSEGTLAIITEVTLRLYPQPEAVAAAICSFPDVASAVDCTIAIMQSGVPIARCELMDANAVRAVNAHDHLGLPESPLLLMEFHGSPSGVREQAQTVQALAQDFRGSDFAWADTPEERSRLWAARHHAYLSALQTKPGCRCVTTDTCVPISKLAQSINATVEEAQAAGLPYFIVGHVGDGNYHIGYLIDPAKPEERELAERLNAQLVRRALALGGTCSGEHGIGLHKQDFLREEAGDDAIDLMRAIKHALDPRGLFNPGKIFV
ncbi:FAD-linked oxidase C-terminal domain-containing protein [Thiomonas sp.]|uniref:FAD-binding oxidoreductase n=1 Tax=Thiomonas sp. TaxID=2047785 RepID=UPI00260E9742|nr:FAD-linked oxidase C-terminal domain-containing protein [Thiomonas sp.]